MPHDLAFLDALERLLDLERAAERARLAQAHHDCTQGELEARGLLLLDVELLEERAGLGGRFVWTLGRSDPRPLAVPFGSGDLVALRPRRAEVAEPPTAVVSSAGRTRLVVAADRPAPPFLAEGRLRVELLASDVTWERQRAALRRLRQMDKGIERTRREVLLGLCAPRADTTAAFEPSMPLNPEQADAVRRGLAARDFFLVHGPPGTGKSTVLAELAVQEARRGHRVLCAAASNAAVDHLLDLCLSAGLRALRVGHPARVAPRLHEHVLDLVVEDHPDRVLARELFDEAWDLQGYARRQRQQGRSRDRFANARESAAQARKLIDEARALERRAVRSVLDSAQVLCATCASLHGELLAERSFDVALVDEATQATEPLTLMAYLKASRVILAGDPQQLPPTVISQEAARGGLATSLFERLLDEHGEGSKQLLREQYRMSEALMAFPSAQMYQGQLRAHSSVAERTLAEVLASAVDAPPQLFLDTAGKGFDEVRGQGSESLQNPGEAELVVARVRELVGAGLSPSELGVIAPYRAQADLLRERLDDAIEVDTVDAFQGREKDAIVLAMTRSNPRGELGFLTDLRRMNVALTRARRHLFIVGDSATLSAHPFYAALIESITARGGYRSAWEWPPPAVD